MVAKEVSVGKGETVLVVVMVRGIVSGPQSVVGWVFASFQADFVVQVSGLLWGMALVRLLLVLRVRFLRTCVRMVI